VSLPLWVVLTGWWLLLIPVYCVLSYQAALIMVASHLTDVLSTGVLETLMKVDALSKLQRNIEEEGLMPSDEELDHLITNSGLGVSVVRRVSEEKVGTYDGTDLHEWIEMWDPHSKKVERFVFESIATKDADGDWEMPSNEGKICALLSGAIYSRAST